MDSLGRQIYSMVLDSTVSSCDIGTFHFSTVIRLRILVFGGVTLCSGVDSSRNCIEI